MENAIDYFRNFSLDFNVIYYLQSINPKTARDILDKARLRYQLSDKTNRSLEKKFRYWNYLLTEKLKYS
jgi:hypothetical protein